MSGDLRTGSRDNPLRAGGRLGVCSCGADPNASLEDGRAPLSVAAYGDRVSVVKLLLSAGADPTI
ncbi:MAG: hypothetical protein ABIY70_03115 [Capsulimonas sp.]|uniref:hypothetical protein n=1 Tax=Capsulimonas sp. TaxID=2494211 RepID=UPI0032660C4A